MAVEGSSIEAAGTHAGCRWAVVQLDLDGGSQPWFTMYGKVLVELNVRRTVKRAEMWALCVALAG